MTRHAKLAILVAVTLVTVLATGIPVFQKANAISNPDNSPFTKSTKKAPVVVSGNNIYVVWWTNKTGNNDEVMFRESTDNGKTFSDKINLSNSSKSDSVDAMIDADGDKIAVTWWERNQATNEPVMRVSNDSGKSFGEIIMLSSSSNNNNATSGSNTR